MPSIRAEDGVDLTYTETGAGTPMVFVHDLAGDAGSWQPQLRFFARRYRCLALGVRAAEGPERAGEDIATVIAALRLAPAHVVGLGAGGFATLHLGLRHPHLARSVAAAGLGEGGAPDLRRMALPVLILAGDGDEPALETSLRIKRSLPRAALAVVPQCGRALNLEEPEAFNRLVLDFATAVDGGAWPLRPGGMRA